MSGGKRGTPESPSGSSGGLPGATGRSGTGQSRGTEPRDGSSYRTPSRLNGSARPWTVSSRTQGTVSQRSSETGLNEGSRQHGSTRRTHRRRGWGRLRGGHVRTPGTLRHYGGYCYPRHSWDTRLTEERSSVRTECPYRCPSRSSPLTRPEPY